MNCPIDNTTLAIADRQGIEIDYCPQCRGVWLDRGELDKLIEKSANAPSAPAQYQQPEPRREEYREPSKYDSHDKNHYKKKKRESFLGDLFDF